MTGISILNHAANKFFLDVLEKLFNDRQKGNKSKYNDFFQILLSSFRESSSNREKDSEIEFDLGSSTKSLSKGDILGQAFMFVLAGFETTPAALHLTIYMLAAHEAYQKRCREEIEHICGTESDITYAMLSEMKYVDQCISETLRMYPPVV
ncbi:hypothetical protein OSTOST_22570, partial [Ostertagia ostertagi]